MSDWDNHLEEEESSFISMTDMMVGLLLIFIILLTYYVLRSQEQIQEAERVSKTEQAAVVARGIILETIIDRIDDERVEFDQTTGTIRFSEEVLTFEPGDFAIPRSAEAVLGTLAIALTETLPCLAYLAADIELDCDWLVEQFSEQELVDRELNDLSRYRPTGEAPLIWIDGVFIEGHTDCTRFSDPSPDFRNWVLGAQRASQTYLFLTGSSPNLGRIFSKDPNVPLTASSAHRVLGVASYADRRPARVFDAGVYPPDHIRADDPEAACEVLANEERTAEPGIMTQNRRNRRIDIRIVMGWTTQKTLEGAGG